MTRPIGIVCIDDNADVCAAIRSYISDRADFVWLGDAQRADGAAALVESSKPDVVIMDIDMPGRSALEVLTELATTPDGVRVVVFSGHSRRALIEGALEGGAWAYVAKADGERALFDAIDRVMRGEIVLSPEASVAMRQRGAT